MPSLRTLSSLLKTDWSNSRVSGPPLTTSSRRGLVKDLMTDTGPRWSMNRLGE